MARTKAPETKAAAWRRLTDEMSKLGHTIDQEASGSKKRLELLRKQASLSDEREALRSTRQ
jgi:hypothetical protein